MVLSFYSKFWKPNSGHQACTTSACVIQTLFKNFPLAFHTAFTSFLSFLLSLYVSFSPLLFFLSLLQKVKIKPDWRFIYPTVWLM